MNLVFRRKNVSQRQGPANEWMVIIFSFHLSLFISDLSLSVRLSFHSSSSRRRQRGRTKKLLPELLDQTVMPGDKSLYMMCNTIPKNEKEGTGGRRQEAVNNTWDSMTWDPDMKFFSTSSLLLFSRPVSLPAALFLCHL